MDEHDDDDDNGNRSHRYDLHVHIYKRKYNGDQGDVIGFSGSAVCSHRPKKAQLGHNLFFSLFLGLPFFPHWTVGSNWMVWRKRGNCLNLVINPSSIPSSSSPPSSSFCLLLPSIDESPPPTIVHLLWLYSCGHREGERGIETFFCMSMWYNEWQCQSMHVKLWVGSKNIFFWMC